MAATLFRDFSFEPASRNHSCTHIDLDMDFDRATMNLSPTSMPDHPTRLPPSFSHSQYCSPPPPPCSMGELAARFNQQSLHVEVDPAYAFSSRPSNDHQSPSPTTSSFPSHILEPAPRTRHSRVSTAVLRMQRQSNARLLQSSPAHLKDISNLVERMLQDGDQCHIHTPSSPPSSASSSSDEDEGIDMSHTFSSLPLFTPSYRRASDRIPGCAHVSKAIRMRRRSPITKR